MGKRWLVGMVVLLFSCGEDQVSKVFLASFSSQAVCEPSTHSIPFTNESGKEMVIEGAAISAGTNASGNFSLDGIIIDGTETASTAGTLTDITIPPGSSYDLKVSYVPQSAEGTHRAVLDITFSEPRGVHQIHLDGTVLSTDTSGCARFDEGGEVGFDGAMTLTVNRLVAATSKLAAALSSDDAITPFQPVALPITLALGGGSVTLPQITLETNFFLPRPNPDVPVLGRCLQQGTIITTAADLVGDYDASVGSIRLEDLIVTLDTDFNTTIEIALTTDRISLSTLPARLNGTAVQEFGNEHYSATSNEIFGSRIDPETGEVALVGTSVIESSTLDEGGCDLTKPSALEGATLAILIEGVLTPNETP